MMRQLAFVLLLTAIGVARADEIAPTPSSAPLSSDITPPAILAATKKAADWQLVHPSPSLQRNGEKAWTYGAFYAGVMALSRIADTPKYHDAMVDAGRKFNWEPASRRYHAD